MYEKLLWLPKAPENFSEILSEASNVEALREIAKFSLDENQLRRLSNKIEAMQVAGSSLRPLIPIKVGLIGNATTKLLKPAMVGTALRFGISLKVVETEFNQVAQVAFSSDSTFFGNQLSAVLVCLDHHGYPLIETPGDKNAAETTLENCFVYAKSLIESLRKKSGAQIIFQNIAPLPEVIAGSYEGRLPGTMAWLISHLNSKLEDLIGTDTFILDVASLASNVGLLNWHDPTLWNIAKLSFSQKYNPIYADFVCRILAARLGKSRRCLILDLDNTIWGGVIGDDGLEGILIGNGDPTAEAHLEVQRMALNLRMRGIVLAVSSKNEDVIARQPFKEHPDMLLRDEHIAVFQANWSDKASNIRAISEMLSLGLESIVFLDDNPAERMQVRRELPDVAVPELPNDPALYARTLMAAGYFEAVTFSEEDRKRADFYQDNAKRAGILYRSSDIDAYLKSLEMEILFSEFDSSGRSRISQLISKSNQFNLTTKRYNEMEVKALEENPNYYTLQMRLKDKLGDNGMISVIICEKKAEYWEIDTWLMSCRVLGRTVEFAALQNIVQKATSDGATRLIGRYIPTPRNGIVKEHYKKLGFDLTHCDEKGEVWELSLKDFNFISLPIKVI